MAHGPMNQAWPRAARRRDAWVFVGIWAAAVVLAACDTPTWVVLRSKCSPDAGANDPACTTVDGTLPVTCEKDLECKPGELCMLKVCTACAKIEPSCPRCEPGSAATTSSVNGCDVCSCVAQACKTHAECPDESVCESGVCLPCSSSSAAKCPATCPWQQKAQPFTRNRCALCECAPVSSCSSDLDCGAGMRCYRGAQCQEDCSEPSCCHGSFCSLAGCEDPPVLSCSLVGCANGRCAGDEACAPPACKCDGATFQCSSDCTAASCKL